MNISTVLINLSYVLVPSLCIYSFVSIFGGIKKSRVLPGVPVLIILYIIYNVLNSLIFIESNFFISQMSYVIDFFFVLYIGSGSLSHRIILAVKAVLFKLGVIFALSFLYVLTIRNIHVVDLGDDWFSVAISTTYLVELNILYSIAIIRKMKKNNLSEKYISLSVTIFLCITGILFLSPMTLNPTYYKVEYIFSITVFVIGITTLAIFTVINGLISVWDQNFRLKSSLDKAAMEEEYYNTIQEGLKQISIIRHDYKNHLSIIDLLLKQHEYEKANEYIQKIYTETNKATNDIVNSPSPIVSSIVTSKGVAIQAHGGKLSFTSDFPGIFFDDFHIVSVLTNILDNAIRAASTADDKEINLSVNQYGDNIIIECLNHYSGKLKKLDGRFLTTKDTDKTLHGLGLESVRQTAEKLHGFVKINTTPETFHISVCIPNIKPQMNLQ